MLGAVAAAPVHWGIWAAFIAFILVFLALDLGVFHRHSQVVKFKEEQLTRRIPFSAFVLIAVTQPQCAGRLTFSIADKNKVGRSLNGTPVP